MRTAASWRSYRPKTAASTRTPAVGDYDTTVTAPGAVTPGDPGQPPRIDIPGFSIGLNTNPFMSQVAQDGRPFGWFADDVGTGDPADVISFEDVNKTIMKLYHASDAQIRAVNAAMATAGNKRYRYLIEAKCSGTNAASGFFVQLLELESDLPAGKNAVGVDTNGEDNIEAFDVAQNLQNNVAITTSWQTFSGEFVVGADTEYFSLLVLNWTGMGTRELHVRKALVIELPGDRITHDGPRSFEWQSDTSGTWPAGNPTQDITVNFYRDGVEIADMTVRGALNSTTGNITLSVQSETGEALTETANGSGTQLAYYDIQHDDSDLQTRVTFSARDLSASGGMGK